MVTWASTAPAALGLAERAERGPLVLCLRCGTYRGTVPAMAALVRPRAEEVIEAHPDQHGAQCEGTGEPWVRVREALEDTVPQVAGH